MNEQCGALDSDDPLHLLMFAARSLMLHMDKSLYEIGLSAAKFGALAQLHHAGEPLGIGQLAKHMGSAKSNATQLVDRLETDALVCRLPNPEDRRSILVQVTPRGNQCFHEGLEIRNQVSQHLREVLSDEEYTQLVDILKRIVASLD
jgi:MarR family transcriptional regulator, transcriptional regulator for hemolysin